MHPGDTGRRGKAAPAGQANAREPDFSLVSPVRAGSHNRAGESCTESLGNHIPHRDCPEKKKEKSKEYWGFPGCYLVSVAKERLKRFHVCV